MEDNQYLKMILMDFDGVILDSEENKLKSFEECLSIYPDHIREFMEFNNQNGGLFCLADDL